MISTINTLKNRILLARKALNRVELDILGVVLGEAQTLEARQGQITDDQVYNIIRKQIESNKEMLTFLPLNDISSRQEKLQKENEILTELLPKSLSAQDIIDRLQYSANPIVKQICSESNTGKAIGVLLKYCKDQGWNLLGSDAKLAVDKIRLLK